jgi:hypothetical protein
VTSIETLASGAVNSITQGVSSLGANALTTANNLVSGTLNSLTSQASSLVTGVVGGAVGQATTALNNLTGGLTTGVAGSVAGLITNASQFGAPVAAAWAAGSTALTGALGSATGIASGFASQAQGAITGALGDLTNMASTALGPITAQAQQLLTSLGGSLDIFGKMSNFSIDFSLFSSDSLVSPTKIAAGFSNTVNRQTVDAAVARILGNAKIPTPTFEYPSLGSINLAADIRYAQNKLNEIAGTASGAISSAASGVVNSASSAISGLIG